ncbi:O-acyltransferase like protein-like [Stomoxys calcitrans]|uniref:O-acyltransferase like protein-like n=1 Tax=Stomoxys calcitrans TaxID=35570 RepID=UPI0027E33BB7|nr:O-acyltransferase like protein-like [Stomoxys calcitrans]
MVLAQVQPDNSSNIWQAIEEHKMGKFHYRHDLLFFGVCVEKCLRFIDSKDDDYPTKETNETLDMEIIKHLEFIHKRPLDIEMRLKYSSLMQRCLNEEFQRKYNLKLKTFIEYCEKGPEDNHLEKDEGVRLLHKVVKGLLLLMLFSSFYDYYLLTHQTEENQNGDFYKNNHVDFVSRILTSFSVARNYYRLNQPYRGKIGKDFAYLDGYRAICTIFVIQAHTFYLQFLHIQNPEYFENIMGSKAGLALLNTSTVIEIYAVMSGLLFTVKFKESQIVTPQTSWTKCLRIFLLIVAARFLRFIPSVAINLLVNGAALSSFADGPFWRHISEPCRTFSRENWWQNIFMINNFTPQHSVSNHTWYLAADFQLFTIYTFVLIFISKSPHYKKHVLVGLSFLSVLIPTAISYYFKLESTYIVKPENYRYGFISNTKEFEKLYIPSYTNLGGYLFGIWCGELYIKFLSREKIRRKVQGVLKYELSILLIIPIGWLIIRCGTITVYFEPSIWTALLSGSYRNLWIVFVCGIPVLTMTCKAGMMAYDFCCLPIFRIIARLSFQMYMWHVCVLQIANGYQRQPHYMTHKYMVGQGMITTTLSIIVAFFVCILVEFPVSQIFDAFIADLKENSEGVFSLNPKVLPERSMYGSPGCSQNH